MGTVRQPWRKVLYEKQDYPDNYVDASFLDELEKNVSTRTYHFWKVSSAASAVSQQISSLCLFVVGFVCMKQNIATPTILLVISVMITLFGYCVITTRWNGKQVKDDAKSLVLFLSFSFGLSPILHTLTDSISTDTIYAMTVFMLGMNLLVHDYGASGAIVSKAVSLNTAIFGSVCLASRLPSSWHTFVTVILAVEIFALFPLFREQLKVTFPSSQALLTWILVVLSFLCVCLVSYMAALFLIFAQVAVIFICPYWLVTLQKYKDNIHGPWDEAVIST